MIGSGTTFEINSDLEIELSDVLRRRQLTVIRKCLSPTR